MLRIPILPINDPNSDDKLSLATRDARLEEEARLCRLGSTGRSSGSGEAVTGDRPYALNAAARETLAAKLKSRIEAGAGPADIATRLDDCEPEIAVNPKLWAHAKPHQREGIQFIWDNWFESLQLSASSKGQGCILAHNMGLGKTFQAITVMLTALTEPRLKIKTVLVCLPKWLLRSGLLCDWQCASYVENKHTCSFTFLTSSEPSVIVI